MVHQFYKLNHTSEEEDSTAAEVVWVPTSVKPTDVVSLSSVLQ
jgi:hypothetical protein